MDRNFQRVRNGTGLHSATACASQRRDLRHGRRDAAGVERVLEGIAARERAQSLQQYTARALRLSREMLQIH